MSETVKVDGRKGPRKIKPLELTKDSVVTYMRNLVRSEPYEVAVGLWGIERERLLTEGKRTLKAEILAELKGFDRAAGLLEEWARKEIREEAEETADLGDQ